ncbi:iron-containing alcohol dehydrogenase [Bacillus sp. Marseille-P3800]|uniref:iron-containing alcohol dehydrogenase n=1 Tax=Bacillus sp. Marseille-P3800 TaxID=2014782 RepID=UPI000C075EF5|nr:iron-containing alcohol dehydrogenase [Bacillus sp. Marseille-P3800]
MNMRVNHLPSTIVYGEDSFKQLGAEAAKAGTHALIISDPIMEQLGNIEKAIQLLLEHGIHASVYTGVNAEPEDTYVYEALEQLFHHNCDHIIAIGGGSCIDTAKAVAVVSTNGGDISDYMNNQSIARKKALPLLVVPTTGGTGSEATDATVITNTTTAVKMMIKQEAFMPQVAIVDPVLTVSSPPSITAATGVDAFTHALEAYLSKKAHPFTDTLALSAIEKLYHHVLIAYKDGKNLQARHEMIYGSMLAGMAFSNSSVCLVHGMSRPIGALFHVPHGVSNAMLLPVVLTYTQNHCTKRLAEIGRVLFPEEKTTQEEQLAQMVVDRIISLCQQLAIPTLSEWGVDQDAFHRVLDKMADDALMSGSPQNNPRVPSKEEIRTLYIELINRKSTVSP